MVFPHTLVTGPTAMDDSCLSYHALMLSQLLPPCTVHIEQMKVIYQKFEESRRIPNVQLSANAVPFHSESVQNYLSFSCWDFEPRTLQTSAADLRITAQLQTYS